MVEKYCPLAFVVSSVGLSELRLFSDDIPASTLFREVLQASTRSGFAGEMN